MIVKWYIRVNLGALKNVAVGEEAVNERNREVETNIYSLRSFKSHQGRAPILSRDNKRKVTTRDDINASPLHNKQFMSYLIKGQK